MRFIFVSILCGLLTACAITGEQASRMTTYDLCKTIYDHRSNANSRPIANAEIERRGYDCRQDRDAILAQISAEMSSAAAIGAIGAALLINSQPQQPAVINQPAPTTCRVVKNPYGDRIYCN